MDRKSITGGVTPAGPSRVQFDFIIDGVRFRPTLPRPPTGSTLERAGKHLARIKAPARSRHILLRGGFSGI